LCLSKSEKIKNSLKKTKEKRKTQICRVFELKIQTNKLSKTTLYYLNRLFLEAKWYENSVISDIQKNLNDEYAKNKIVPIKYIYNMEQRNLYILSSQMKQGINKKIQGSLRTLSSLKKKKKKVGRLKYRKSVDSIDLKQYGITYKLKKNKLSLQGFPNILPLTLNSMKQLNIQDIELANAKLIKTFDGFYLKITTYMPKSEQKKNDKIIGLDMGIKNQITLSNGLSFQYKISETKKLKRLQRKLSKKKGTKEEKSKNFNKQLKKVKKEYKKITHQRNNINNHIFSYLKEYKYICMQDEMIKSWHSTKMFGRTIQYTGIGKLKAKLKNLDASNVLSRTVATTKTCIYCNNKYSISLKERKYNCPECHKKYNRDIGSAINMILFSFEEERIPMEDRKFKTTPVEKQTSVLKKWKKIHGLNVSYTSWKQEASPFRVG